MAQFNKEMIMRITKEDKMCLIYGHMVLAEIKSKMDEENAEFLEHTNTGEIIEVEDIKKAFWTINSLIDDKFGKEWKLV